MVVKITASGPIHSFANIINYIYSKFHNDLACIWALMDQNVKQCTDFAVYFHQIRWFDITAFAFKAPKVQEVVEITASGPLLHSFANIINYIYSTFHNDLAGIRVVMDQNVKQCTDFVVYFHQIRWFDITPFGPPPFQAQKVQEVVKITASGHPLSVCKYYKLYMQQILQRSGLYSGRNVPESETMKRFRCVFLSNTMV